jgi:hypothetical protein
MRAKSMYKRLPHRFMEDAFKERLDRSEHKWRKKLDHLRAAA